MRDTMSFLCELAANNNKQWFDANRERYRVLRARFDEFTAELIDGISTFDAEVHGLTPKECIFRINRDTRFSANKAPYKTHFSAYICPRGKKSGYAGYYFHLEPESDRGMIGRSILAAGAVCIPTVVLKSIREEIIDNGDQMLASIAAADGFEVSLANSLKRTPAGFPTDTPYDELLRLKDVCLERTMNEEWLYSDRLAERTIDAFRTTQPFIAQINRAIRYAYEEMM